jgi:hypothetical protein
MENDEPNFACDACGKDLKAQSYRLRAYQDVGAKVLVEFRYSFCHDCYTQIRPKIRQALIEAFIHMLQEDFGKFKQEMQAAGLKIGK